MDPRAPAPAQSLDPMQLLLGQLGRIERSIESLPALLERVDALTRSVADLGFALTESSRESREAIADIRLRNSETMAAIVAISADVVELKRDSSGLKVRVDSMDGAMTLIELERAQEREAETRWVLFMDEFQKWRPWLAGFRWAVLLAGGILLSGLVVGVIWAFIQSRGGGLF